jgi:hypothetical protein
MVIDTAAAAATAVARLSQYNCILQQSQLGEQLE